MNLVQALAIAAAMSVTVLYPEHGARLHEAGSALRAYVTEASREATHHATERLSRLLGASPYQTAIRCAQTPDKRRGA